MSDLDIGLTSGGAGGVPVGGLIDLPADATPPPNYSLTDVVLSQADYPDLFNLLGVIPNAFDAPWTYEHETIQNDAYGVAYGNGVFVSGSQGWYIRSTDGGLTWSDIDQPDNHAVGKIVFGNNIFAVVTGRANETFRSTDDGLTWTNASSFPHGADRDAIAFGNDVFITMGEMGYIFRSTDDCLSWTIVSSPGAATTQMWDLAFANDVFVGVGAGGTIWRSTDDGQTWTSVSTPGTADLRAVTYVVGSIFLAAGSNGTIWRSTDDGQTWTSVSTPRTATIYALAYGDGVVVAGDDAAGYILYSDDYGLTWSDSSALSTNAADIYGLAYADGVFIGVGNHGRVFRWTPFSYNINTQFYVPQVGHDRSDTVRAIKLEE